MQSNNDDHMYHLRQFLGNIYCIMKPSSLFLEKVLTAENHEQQNQCYAYPRTLLSPPMEHLELLHQPTWNAE
jgi:hypothetical protein